MAALWTGGPAAAATFTVDTTADAHDDLPGDGVCADALGDCTLRAAVDEANALAGPDVVDIPAGTYVLTTDWADGLGDATYDSLEVTSDITFYGAGMGLTVVSGNGEGPCFSFLGTAADPPLVDIYDMTITRGGSEYWRLGGNIYSTDTYLQLHSVEVSEGHSDNPCCTRLQSYGGGIAAFGTGTVILDSSYVHDNVAYSGDEHWGYAGFGGGIYSEGDLYVVESTIEDNVARGDGWIVWAYGGGIFNAGVLYMNDSVVTGNWATEEGGGIYNSGYALVENSTFDRNRADDGAILIEWRDWPIDGGGIVNTGTLDMSSSTVSRNFSGTGGGVYQGGTGTLNLENVTISNNEADTGGGLAAASGTVTLSSVTIASNVATGAGDTGGLHVVSAAVSLWNSLLGRNNSYPNDPDCSGTVTSFGNNLVSVSEVGGVPKCVGLLASDLRGTDAVPINPRIRPLGSYGGTTETRKLLQGSRAVDAGNDALCPPDDQRGRSRPFDANGDGVATCDIGSFEISPH